MQFDPIHKELFTDSGEFIKRMHCPYKVSWDRLEATGSFSRLCAHCDKVVLDTQTLGDQEVLALVRENPETCLKIDLNQANIRIVSNGIFGNK